MANETEGAPIGEVGVWLASARGSQDRLAAQVAALDEADLTAPSYCRDWTIAQVLSHLGSQAEIVSRFLDAGLEGREPPEMETFEAIWALWNARTPAEQGSHSVEANERLVERLEQLDEQQQASFRVPMFGREADLVQLLRMRLGEQAMHAWDVAVARNPAARLHPQEVALLVDGLPAAVARLGKPAGKPAVVAVTTTDPARSYLLHTDGVRLEPGPGPHDGSVELPAEAFLRLAYGRLDQEHGGGEVRLDGVSLEDLRAIFPGF